MSLRLKGLWNAPTAVYRAWASDGLLLYVGISADPESRMQAHKHLAEWGFDFRHATVTWHPDRHAAGAAEIRAIRFEHPVYNDEHSICRCGRADVCIVCAQSVPRSHRDSYYRRWTTWAQPPEHQCPSTFIGEPGGKLRIMPLKPSEVELEHTPVLRRPHYGLARA